MLDKTLAAALAATLFAIPAFADGVEIHDAYAITARPGAPSGAAFMAIHNHGETDDHLLSVSAPVAARVELHTHVVTEGIASMVAVPEGWELPAGGELLLERGGHHVMFMGITEPFTDGMVFPLTLTFAAAGEITVDVVVDLERLTEDAMDHGDSGHAGH